MIIRVALVGMVRVMSLLRGTPPVPIVYRCVPKSAITEPFCGVPESVICTVRQCRVVMLPSISTNLYRLSTANGSDISQILFCIECLVDWVFYSASQDLLFISIVSPVIVLPTPKSSYR